MLIKTNGLLLSNAAIIVLLWFRRLLLQFLAEPYLVHVFIVCQVQLNLSSLQNKEACAITPTSLLSPKII